MDREIARLTWRCRRGMRELDLVTTRYLDERYRTASERERAAFRQLLELPDPQLFAFLTGRETPAAGPLAELVDVLRGARDADG